eukprot:199277-Chlamydomonas_euryale.AAC.3
MAVKSPAACRHTSVPHMPSPAARARPADFSGRLFAHFLPPLQTPHATAPCPPALHAPAGRHSEPHWTPHSAATAYPAGSTPAAARQRKRCLPGRGPPATVAAAGQLGESR